MFRTDDLRRNLDPLLPNEYTLTKVVAVRISLYNLYDLTDRKPVELTEITATIPNDSDKLADLKLRLYGLFRLGGILTNQAAKCQLSAGLEIKGIAGRALSDALLTGELIYGDDLVTLTIDYDRFLNRDQVPGENRIDGENGRMRSSASLNGLVENTITDYPYDPDNITVLRTLYVNSVQVTDFNL